MTSAVLDAGPLIHLAELDVLDALSNFDSLYVPDAVWDEVATHQPQILKAPGLPIERVSISTLSPELQTLAQALALDRGEIQALGLLQDQPQCMFLTDDAAARLAAEQLGYEVHGTIGLIIRSVRRGARTPQIALAVLGSIPERSTLFINPNLLANILRKLESEWTSPE
ncbi:MAG TPA: DNA-binding protein [Anaerolineae bacterium]|nr:DNA-binding protein [Anaerolineae bacterium]